MFKKIFYSLCLFLILVAQGLVGVLEVGAQTSATLSLSPSSGTFNRGCTFSLEIKVDTSGAQTDGTDAILFYDPTRFTATKITNGTIYNSYPQSNIFAEEGKVAVAGVASVSAPFQGVGTLATVDFTVSDTAPTGATQIKFDFDSSNKDKTNDSNVVDRATTSDILGNVRNGSFTIGSGTCSSNNAVAPTKALSKGGVDDQTNDIPLKTLPKSGSFETTLALGIAGGTLILIGILGLLLL